MHVLDSPMSSMKCILNTFLVAFICNKDRNLLIRHYQEKKSSLEITRFIYAKELFGYRKLKGKHRRNQ